MSNTVDTNNPQNTAAIKVSETTTEIVTVSVSWSDNNVPETNTEEIVTEKDSSSWFGPRDVLWISLGLFPGVMIALGALHHHDCPAQPYIPIYLEVMGGSVLVVLYMFLYFHHKPSTFKVALVTVGTLFVVSWFITGNVWIYGIYEPNYNELITQWIPHCNKSLYLFAFWTTTVVYILASLFLLCACCCCCCCCLAGLPHRLLDD